MGPWQTEAMTLLNSTKCDSRLSSSGLSGPSRTATDTGAPKNMHREGRKRTGISAGHSYAGAKEVDARACATARWSLKDPYSPGKSKQAPCPPGRNTASKSPDRTSDSGTDSIRPFMASSAGSSSRRRRRASGKRRGSTGRAEGHGTLERQHGKRLDSGKTKVSRLQSRQAFGAGGRCRGDVSCGNGP
jgi:hypothetical protein